MTSDLIRAFGTPDLEIRSAAKGGDGRTIVGIAVPYGVAMRINHQLVEQFARGVFNRQLNAAHRVKVSREHIGLGGQLIGKVAVLRDDAAGLYSEMRVSATPLGDETLELVRDGALTDLSVGFKEGQNRRLQDGTVERVTGHLREIAVTLEGAYGDAAVATEVRTVEEFANLERARQIIAAFPILPAAA